MVQPQGKVKTLHADLPRVYVDELIEWAKSRIGERTLVMIKLYINMKADLDGQSRAPCVEIWYRE